MINKLTEENGILMSEFTPAVYFDASVIIDYWMTEGMELSESQMDKTFKQNELPYLQVARDILKSDKRVNKVAEIRRRILSAK